MVALSQARFLRPVCFTGAEGFARGFLSSRRATLSASLKNSANSNYSRTYVPPPGRGYTGLLVRPFPQLFCFPYLRKNRGCTLCKMSARRHFLSLFSQSTHSALLLFNHLRTLSISVSNLSPAIPISSALFPQ